MLLASGVTGWREMASWGSTPRGSQERQTRAAAGRAGTARTGGRDHQRRRTRPTPAAAIAEVRRQKDLGADFIKIIDYSPGVFNAVAGECKRQGMRFIGHLSPTVSPRDAAAAGMKSMEHVGTRDSVLLGCSSDEAALRPAFIPIPARPPASGPGPLAIIEKSVANPTLNTPATDYARYQRVVDTFDETRAKELATHFVAAGTWHVPDADPRADDGDRRRPGGIATVRTSATCRRKRKRCGKASRSSSTRRFLPPPAKRSRPFTPRGARAAKIFKDAGVAMMTGSDVGGRLRRPRRRAPSRIRSARGRRLHAARRAADDDAQRGEIPRPRSDDGQRGRGPQCRPRAARCEPDREHPEPAPHRGRRSGGARTIRTGALAALKQKTADRVASGVAYTATPAPPCC